MARGKATAEEAQRAAGLVEYPAEPEALAECAVVIEAIVEDLEVKAQWFQRLDQIVGATTLLASNTSSIPIAGLAAVVSSPERVLGLHFFSPVPVMRLVEIVRALDTAEHVLEFAERFVRSIDKIPILAKDRSGFIVNMLLVPYMIAGVRMYEEGFASREDIDTGMTLGAGHPMGPLTLCDMVGIDVLHAVCESLFAEFRRAEYAPPPLLKRMLAAGRLGRKSGRGFYEYESKPASGAVAAVAQGTWRPPRRGVANGAVGRTGAAGRPAALAAPAIGRRAGPGVHRR